VIRLEAHEPLDFDFESIDGGGLVERRADLRKRRRHGRLWSNTHRLGGPAHTRGVALMPRPAHISRMLVERHLFSGSPWLG
jgi:hypothetical protein